LRDSFDEKQVVWGVLDRIRKNLLNQGLADSISMSAARYAGGYKEKLVLWRNWHAETSDQSSKRDALVAMLS
jgi:hypothetical protein